MYLDTLKSLAVYKQASSYARVSYDALKYLYVSMFVQRCLLNLQCRDTYWIESFNHALLTYLPKRVHFGKSTFEARMDLAVLDWVCYFNVHDVFVRYNYTFPPCHLE